MDFSFLHKLAHSGCEKDVTNLLVSFDIRQIFNATHKASGNNILHSLAQWDRADLLKCIFDSQDLCPNSIKENVCIAEKRVSLPVSLPIVDLEYSNKEGKQPIHEAAQFSSINMVKLLLEKGVEVDCLKRADWTPLMLACSKPNLSVIQLLIKAGASLDLCNKDGWSPFHIASREGHVQIVQFLLSCKPTAWNTRSKNGRTSLHTAALHGHNAVVQLLLARGRALIDVADSCGVTPLMVDVADSCGVTPLMDALRAGHTDTADIILQAEADVQLTDSLGRSICHISAEAGQLASIQWLEQICDVIADLTSTQQTPLHLAAKEGHVKVLEHLICRGADVNAKDKNARTALHLASSGKSVECVQLLLESGADPDSTDKSGLSPAQTARNASIKALLQTPHLT